MRDRKIRRTQLQVMIGGGKDPEASQMQWLEQREERVFIEKRLIIVIGAGRNLP